MAKQSLARNGYSEEAVKAALHAANRTLDFRFDLLDSAGKFKADITSLVRKGSVHYDSEAQIKRTARFELADSGIVSAPSDRIRPWVRLAMPPLIQTVLAAPTDWASTNMVDPS